MKFGIIGNIKKSLISSVIPSLVDWLIEKEIEFIVERVLHSHLSLPAEKVPSCSHAEIGEKCDIVLAFGGDGTILSTARAVGRYHVPILGVNLGSLGFLAEVSIDHLFDSIEDIIDNNYRIVERLVLRTEVLDQEKNADFFCLNDVVVDRGGRSRIIRLDIYINDEFLTSYLGDGVIIATPTGSTAYSLSAYGPIVSPDVDGIIINPICPHSLGARPMVISADSEIRIIPVIGDMEALLSTDGQEEYRLRSNKRVIIKKADYKVRWIQYKGNTFYNVLRTKLNWGFDKRMD